MASVSAAPTQVPVALLVFNRPELTERVLAAIAAARPTRLLVVGDGPRADRPGEPELVARTRSVLERVDWPCQVQTCYADTNLGCKDRISSGLDWVFSQVEEAIILEDDCLPDPSFFPFCEELLERYRDDERVQMISGCNVLAPNRVTESSYYFSRCYHIWGWASWARAWAHYDVDMRRWPQVRDTSWLRDLLGNDVHARVAREIFERTYLGEPGTWDFQWAFAGWMADALAVIPAPNLVSNLGYGSQATHQRNPSLVAKLPRGKLSFPLRHPPEVSVLQAADDAEWARIYPDYHRASGSARSRTLVLGAAVGQEVEYVAPFLVSLRRAGYDGDVALFVDRRLARTLRADPIAEGVRLIAVPQWPPFRFELLQRPRRMRYGWGPVRRLLWALVLAAGRLASGSSRRLALQCWLAQRLYSPMETRFLHFHRFLSSHSYEQILLSDVRDVVFQRDPFTDLSAYGLAVGVEVDRYTIATERHNAGWIARVYGRQALEEIGASRVSNVGVVYGRREPMLRYLALMGDEILRTPPPPAGDAGTDTAIHNRLLWTGRLGEVELLEPLASPVATLNCVAEAEVRLNEHGHLITADGHEPAVLHQYDRIPALRSPLLRALA